MSVEGMWAVQTGTDETFDNLENGGIAVLETERVFGGDERVACVGEYRADGDVLTVIFDIWTWNPANASETEAYGIVGPFKFKVEGRLRRQGQQWVGHSWPVDGGDRLSLVMTKMAELP